MGIVELTGLVGVEIGLEFFAFPIRCTGKKWTLPDLWGASPTGPSLPGCMCALSPDFPSSPEDQSSVGAALLRARLVQDMGRDGAELYLTFREEMTIVGPSAVFSKESSVQT